MSKDKETTDNNMILVEAGRFEMGKESEAKLLIRITNDYFISKFPVTFIEYDEFCENLEFYRREKEDENWGRGNRPVINVTWYDAIEYCNWKSKKEELEEVYTIKKKRDKLNQSGYDDIKWKVTCNFDKNGYRLPTEAEWEFAARGGNKSKGNYKYSGSNELKEVAYYEDNSEGKTFPVGYKESNILGIHDMSGNVHEWCWDWYYWYDKIKNDPKGSRSGSYRVLRGGSWFSNANYCQVGYRYYEIPSTIRNQIGFRIARTC